MCSLCSVERWSRAAHKAADKNKKVHNQARRTYVHCTTKCLEVWVYEGTSSGRSMPR